MKSTLKSITMSLAVSAFMGCTSSPTAVSDINPKDSISTTATSKQEIIPAGWEEIFFRDKGTLNNMAYADTANFTHRKIYGCARCLLRHEVALAFRKAEQIGYMRGFRIIVYDCYRPKIYQRKMFEIVGDSRYVADTIKGSFHNKGCAVDVSLANMQGEALDMGTAFDNFTEAAHIDARNISLTAAKNRKLLGEIMTTAGFETYEFEWWHFNYPGCRYEAERFTWNCP